MLDDHHHGAPHLSVWLPAPPGVQQALEAGLVTAGTFGVSLFVYELAVRRSSLLRFLFGLKHEPARAGETRRAPGEPVAG